MRDATGLSRQEKVLTLVGMALAMFLAALDQTVVATAGPDIQRALGMDAGLYTWITTAYLVSSTVLVPVFGRLSDLAGRRQVVVFGVVVFVGASALCGLSEHTWQLLAARALQGVGAASLFTSAFAVVADLFPPEERGKYSGLFGAVFGVSSLVGPLLGGFITDTFGWHWVFFINLPLGALALAFILLRMPPLKPTTPPPGGVDVPGAVLLALGVVPLLVALSLGRPSPRPGEHGWSSPLVLGLFAVAAVGVVAFALWERRAAHPLVDFRLFRVPTVAWGSATVFVMGGAFLTPMVFLPLFMVNVVGVTATASGLTISPLVLGVVAGNVVSGQLVSRFGHMKELMLASLSLLVVGFVVMATTLTVDSTQGEVTAKMVLLGLGLGPSIPLYTLAMQNAVPVAQLGVTTSMVTFLRQMGSTVGIALVGSLFAASLSEGVPARVAEATAGVPAALVASVAPGGSAGFSADGPAGERFDAAKVKARVADLLEGAVSVAARALDGDARAMAVVAESPLADAALKEAVARGGVRAQARAEATVLRAGLRAAARDEAAWLEWKERAGAAFTAEAPPLDEAALTALDARLEAEGERRAAAAHAQAVAAVQARVDAERPGLFALVDRVDHALKAAFTEAIVRVYRVALVLALLALALTSRLPRPAARVVAAHPPSLD